MYAQPARPRQIILQPPQICLDIIYQIFILNTEHQPGPQSQPVAPPASQRQIIKKSFHNIPPARPRRIRTLSRRVQVHRSFQYSFIATEHQPGQPTVHPSPCARRPMSQSVSLYTGPKRQCLSLHGPVLGRPPAAPPVLSSSFTPPAPSSRLTPAPVNIPVPALYCCAWPLACPGALSALQNSATPSLPLPAPCAFQDPVVLRAMAPPCRSTGTPPTPRQRPQRPCSRRCPRTAHLAHPCLSSCAPWHPRAAKQHTPGPPRST